MCTATEHDLISLLGVEQQKQHKEDGVTTCNNSGFDQSGECCPIRGLEFS